MISASCVVGDDERHDERDREAEALEGDFLVVGDDERDDERDRSVNSVDGAPRM